MRGSELPAIRAYLGELWGLDRPLRKTEFGRCVGLSGAHHHQSVWRWETTDSELPGPVIRVVEAMVFWGYRPSYLVERRKPSRTVGSDL